MRGTNNTTDKSRSYLSQLHPQEVRNELLAAVRELHKQPVPVVLQKLAVGYFCFSNHNDDIKTDP